MSGYFKIFKNKKNAGVFVLLLLELAGIVLCIMQGVKEEKQFIFGGDSILSEELYLENFLETGEAGYYMDSSMEKKPAFASTQAMLLPSGQYKITLHYRTDSDGQSYILTAENADFREWFGNYHKNLASDKNAYTTSIWTHRTLKDFEVQFDYSGDGYLFVSQVDITESREWYFALAALLAFLFLLVDIAVIYWERTKAFISAKNQDCNSKNVLAGLLLIIIFISLPLFCPYLFKGHDLTFHLLRIEGVKEGLLGGQFPVRIQPVWINGYGYGASFFYGDILLYFPAMLRMIGFGVQTSYKIFLFAVNVAAVLVSYYCFQRFFRQYMLSLLGTFLYTASIYRLNCIYVRAAVGEYTALIFLPLILVGITEILSYEDAGKKKRSWLLAAAGFSGLIYTHVITCETSVITTAVFCLIYFKKTFRKNALCEFLKMAAGIFVMSVGFMLPFLDMFRDAYWFGSDSKGSLIQSSGTFFSQLFNLFPQASENSWAYAIIDGLGEKNELSYSLGGGYLAGLILFFAYFINVPKKYSKEEKLSKNFITCALILTFMTTAYFPWNDIQNSSGLLNFLIENIQFAWRLLSLVTVFFSFAVCLIVKMIKNHSSEQGKNAFILILIFALISSGYLLGDRINDNYSYCIFNKDDLDTFDFMGGEYIPIGVDGINKMTSTELAAPKEIEIQSLERCYQRVTMECINRSTASSYIDLPLIYYRGYEGRTQEGNLTVCASGTGRVRVIIPQGFNGNITVDYEDAWYWKLAWMISAIGSAGIAVYMLVSRHRQNV